MKKWLVAFVLIFAAGCADEKVVGLFGECTTDDDCAPAQLCGTYACQNSGEGCWLMWKCTDAEECKRDNVCYKDPSACDTDGCGEVVKVAAGTFKMGCEGEEPECMPMSKPAHDVTFAKAFYIDRTEVTVAQYAACAAEGVYDKDGYVTSGCDFPNLEVGDCNWKGRGDMPINCVSWNQADRFCEWSGKRLCTEAEWEYAARGPGSKVYPWDGNTECEELTSCEKTNVISSTETTDVGGCGDTLTAVAMPENGETCDKSDAGALYMAGNVFEWVQDFLHSSYASVFSNGVYENAPTDGSEWEFDLGGRRVARGGRPDAENPTDLRLHRRFAEYPPFQSDSLGFRCCANWVCDTDADCQALTPPKNKCLSKANGVNYCANVTEE